MIVLDASAAVELALGSDIGRRLRPFLEGQALLMPAHCDAEVLSTLRRSVRRGLLPVERAAEALADTVALRAERVPLHALVAEAFELRDRLSAFDALYVVLARRIGARLLTLDGRMARAATGLVEVVFLDQETS